MTRFTSAFAWTIPNILSLIRLVLAGSLPVVAWFDRPKLFFILLFTALFTDAVDGWIARALSQTSQLGTRLDSWSDLVLSFSVPLSVWWLFPDLVRLEGIYFLTLIVSYLIPTLVALVKYRRIPSYHTRIAKVAGVLTGITGLLLLLGGPALPFHLVVFLVVVEALEETAITFVLPTLTGNVASFSAALKITRPGSQE